MADEIPSLQLADYMDIFTGNIHNYGVHQYAFTKEGKEAGKNSTVTNKLVTIAQYKDHLAGKMGLGIIPISEKGEAKFGVIDLDVYDSDLSIYLEAIEASNFPLVPFRSKSGGLHIYMFLKQAVAAKVVIDLLNDMIVLLSLDLYIKHKLNRIIEVFPKQSKASAESIGSWINMPYYNASDTKQYAIRGGSPLTLDEALAHIKMKRATVAEIKNFLGEIAYKDGPPCLQSISLLRFLDKNSGRNNFLFSFAVYLKKKDPEFWEQGLFEVNESLKAPLLKDEIEGTIIGSLRKKDYIYKCNEAPCVDFCRKALCKKRDFGIGKEGGYFSDLDYGQLFQIQSYEPYYEWEIKALTEEKFKRLRFKNEQDIIGQDAFLKLCFRELHILPIKLKQSEWFKLLNQSLATMQVVEVAKEDDTAPIGLFKSILLEFLTDRAMAQTREQILNKRVYFDASSKVYYFRTVDLIEFIFTARSFKFYSPGDIHGLLKDFKVYTARIRLDGDRQIRVYAIKEEDVMNIGMVNTEVFKAEFAESKEQF
jgi:hypothetical protein